MPQPNDQVVGLVRLSPTGPGAQSTTATRPLAGEAAGAELRVDLCVIGGGSGGLSVAAAAAQLGVSVALVEKHKMGGDCLNYGCVPSKALIAAGKRAQLMRAAAPFGITPVNPTIDPAAVHDHVHDVIAAIAPNDSVERFTGLGVRVIQASGHFTTRDTLLAGDQRIKARRFVIATGSSPLIPPIPGIDNVPYFTNETIFDNREKLPHLVIIGGGPIGLELAQAHLRLGSRVTVIEAQKALAKDDPELTQVVLQHLRTEGVDIREGVQVERISGGTRLIDVHVSQGGSTIGGAGLAPPARHRTRRPIPAASTWRPPPSSTTSTGSRLSRGLVTSNRKVYAIGDVIGGPQFTHVANYHAGIVIRRAVLRLSASVDHTTLPWVTFTDPELAHVGLTEELARRQVGRVRVYRWPYHENDRAQAERATAGFVKVVTDRKGTIKGASIVGAHAGEVIQMWSLAISQGLDIKAMTQWISPYPTLSEINKRAAFGYYASAASSPLVRRVVGWLARLG